MTLDIATFAIQTRDRASNIVARQGQKKTSFELYAVLAPCLELCERCLRDPAEQAALDRLFADQPKGKRNRHYVEKGSDIYLHVARFVFCDGERNRNNAWRYSVALREAAKSQIGSEDLAAWLKDNGGVNALYFKRPLDIVHVTTKALRLARPITYPRDRPFTLTLRWTRDNAFDVLKEAS
jgi:hypothetical protein